MINVQRVKRIRSCIYSVIVLLILLPLILLVVLCVSMISFMGNASSSLERIETYLVGDASPSSTAESQPDISKADNPQLSSQSEISSKADPVQPDEADDNENNPVEPTDTGDSAVKAENTVAMPENQYKPTSYPEVYFDTIAPQDQYEADTLYLTFDNTPASHLPEILEVLEKHDVKATFFVWGGEPGGTPALSAGFTALIKAGHSIGIHSGDPALPLSSLYGNVDAFLADFSGAFNNIEKETGVRTRLYRLPGGSVNFNSPARQAVLNEIREEMSARGFILYDWTTSAQDAAIPPLSMQQILSNLYTNIEKGQRVIALMHDGTGADTTVKALDELIEACKEEGFTFKALDEHTKPFTFG